MLQWNNSSLPNKSISFRNTGKNDDLAFPGGYRQYSAHQWLQGHDPPFVFSVASSGKGTPAAARRPVE